MGRRLFSKGFGERITALRLGRIGVSRIGKFGLGRTGINSGRLRLEGQVLTEGRL